MARVLQVPARYYARLAEMVAELGCDTGSLLQQAGIDPAHMAAAEASLPLPAVERFISLLPEATGRTDLAVDFGRRLKLSSHSVLGYALLSSPSVDYAYRLVARYFRMIMPPFRLRYRRGPEQAEIRLQAAEPMSAAYLAFHIETIAVAWHWESQELVQHALPAYELQLSMAAPPHAARYAELQGARCSFGWPMTPGFRVLMPAASMDEPVFLADAAALTYAEDRCRAMVDRARARGSLAAWVEMMLRESQDAMPSATELARMLNLSRQTLHRALRDEGVRFRDVADRARFGRACALLQEGHLSVSQVAFALGYSDSSNFARAFSRQSGLAPRAWQKAQSQSRADGMSAATK